ncbi:MAG: hypothetical protein IKS20_15450 [Victivallales bacterium]|nr:hypothetical protein [Victivallales bacterium]
MFKTLIALVVGAALIASAQTKVTTEMQTTVSTTTTKVAAEVEQKALAQRKVALVVQNHAHGADIPMGALTDALTAKLSGRGFQVINPYNAIGVNQNRSVAGEPMPAASAQKLALGLGAEGLVTASVFELLDSTIGTPVVLHQYSVRISISLADAVTGATVCGETVKKISPKYTNNQVAQNRLEYLGDLLYAAAEECAAKLEANPAVRAWRPTPPPPPPQPSKPQPPATSLDRKVDALVHAMLLNPQFVKNYEGCRERLGGRLPIVVIGGIENKSGNDGLDGLIEAAGERFRVMLFNSKLFEVKDDGVLVALAKRIVGSGNSPLEDGELMGALKQHGSPDFFVAGDLRRLTDLDGVGYYKLRIAIHSLANGRIVWEEIETFKI